MAHVQDSGHGVTARMERDVGRREWPGALARPVVSVEDGRTLLRVGGVIQSVAVDERHEPDVWDAMLPLRPPENALILGLGGGTTATLLTRRFGAVPVLGIERDPRIARLAQERFGLAALSNVQVMIADAFAFLPRCPTHFDLICVDLYVAGKLEHGVFGTDFLRAVGGALTPEGTATFNLWRSPYLADHLRRLRRVLDVRDIIEVGDNIVAHCDQRPLVTILPR